MHTKRSRTMCIEVKTWQKQLNSLTCYFGMALMDDNDDNDPVSTSWRFPSGRSNGGQRRNFKVKRST